MKKIVITLMLVFLVTGCTVVRIDTDSIDNTINVILSKNNDLYNTVGKGYKYYKPRGVTYIDTNEYNEKLYSNGNYYYLYVDINSYYYKKEFTYEENNNAYYSRKIDINNKLGYLEINKYKDKYLIEFMYNYAKIEALVDEKDINDVVLNSSYILSTIKFNSKVIKIMLNDNYFINKEERYDVFTPKEETMELYDYDESNEGD
ncbi:MAG: hypothetical protein E7169_04875 [Firmicutes bacterium]|nr:hypothetical protein [Bacillota bacterium]